jgi:hypothetical protein
MKMLHTPKPSTTMLPQNAECRGIDYQANSKVSQRHTLQQRTLDLGGNKNSYREQT